MNIVILITIATVAIVAAVKAETYFLKKEIVKSEEIIKNYIDLKAKLTSMGIGLRLDDVIDELNEDHAQTMEEIKDMHADMDKLPEEIKKMIIQQLVVPVRKSF
ncbi:hypothetical protein [Clostridium algidicarnis]|uniref:hypothetical protein n=1 Tax=Clostridium algidicarnis TaxID=37659 RepID=UPI003FD6D4E6